MENNIPQITFCIASKNNLRYLKHAVRYIKENCYRNDHDIIVMVDGKDEDGTLQWCADNNVTAFTVIPNTIVGIARNYNEAVKKSKTDFVIIYHADMIAGKHMDLNMFNQWKPGLVVSATRIEPPLHPADVSKIVEDFGMWPEEDVVDGFKKEMFDNFVEANLNTTKVTKGVFAPWLIHKDDYWAVGGHDEDFNSHSEDRDLFNRFLLNGFDFVQPWNALVYHLTCRGGQFEHATKTEELTQRSNEWNKLAGENTKKFIKKWGTPPMYDAYQYPIVVPKYDIGLIIHNPTNQLIEFLKPYFSNISTDAPLKNDIVVEVDAKNITNQLPFLLQLPLIIKESGQIGEMEWDIFKLTIKSLTEYQNGLIKVK